MFNKLKQFKDLRQQAKTIQNTLGAEVITVDKNGVKITINGNMEITNLKIDNSLERERLENSLTIAVNYAIKEIQKIVAGKMKDMGDLSSLLKY